MTRKTAAAAMPWVLSLGFALTLAEGEPSEPQQQKFATLKELAGQEQFVTDAGDEIVFPQVADGVGEGIGITTAIFLTNAEEDELMATLRFRRSDGLGMVVDLYRLGTDELVGSGDSFSVTVPASQSVFLETGGSGSITVGWASVSVPSGKRIGGGAVYSLMDPDTRQVSAIVGVEPSAATPAFSLPVVKDDGARTRTALALANSSGGTARLKAYLLDSEADHSSTRTLELGPGQHMAQYVHELFSEVGPRFYGTLHLRRVNEDDEPVEIFDVHPMALLQSGRLFSSIPVTSVPITTRIHFPGGEPATRPAARITVSPHLHRTGPESDLELDFDRCRERRDHPRNRRRADVRIADRVTHRHHGVPHHGTRRGRTDGDGLGNPHGHRTGKPGLRRRERHSTGRQMRPERCRRRNRRHVYRGRQRHGLSADGTDHSLSRSEPQHRRRDSQRVSGHPHCKQG